MNNFKLEDFMDETETIVENGNHKLKIKRAMIKQDYPWTFKLEEAEVPLRMKKILFQIWWRVVSLWKIYKTVLCFKKWSKGYENMQL